MFRCVVCLFLLNIHIIIELILNIRSLRSRENTLSFYITLIRYLHLSDNVPCFPYITFVFKFLLGIVVVPGEIEDNAQLKQFFWGGGAGEGGRTRYIMEMRKQRIFTTISETGRELYLANIWSAFLENE